MCNPLSDDPKYALYPLPPNSAGGRLCQMLRDCTGVSKAEYIQGFERINLVIGDWDARDARAAAEEFVRTHQGRRVVILGSSVRIAFRLPPVLVEPVVSRGVVFRQLPHPSGRCRWYNDPKHRALAGMVLEEELRR